VKLSTEEQIQVDLFNWARYYETQHPELALLFHPPNGGKRSRMTGAKLKAMGVKAGVPDVCLPVPRQGYGSLWIELKSPQGRMQESQKEWYQALTLANNKVVVCRSWAEASDVILDYLRED